MKIKLEDCKLDKKQQDKCLKDIDFLVELTYRQTGVLLFLI